MTTTKESGYKRALRLNTLATEIVTIAKVIGAEECAKRLKTGVDPDEQAPVLRRALKQAKGDTKKAISKIAEDLFPDGLSSTKGAMPTKLKVSQSRGRKRPHVCLPIPDGFDVKKGDYVEVVVTSKTFGIRPISQ